MCDYCAGDPSYIQADRRSRWVLSKRGTADRPAESGATSTSPRKSAPVSVSWSGADRLRAELTDGAPTPGTTLAYITELERKVRALSGSDDTASAILARGRLAAHTSALVARVRTSDLPAVIRLRAARLNFLSAYTQSKSPARLDAGLTRYTSLAARLDAAEAASKLLYSWLSAPETGPVLKGRLSEAIVSSFGDTRWSAGARTALARLASSSRRPSVAAAHYEAVLAESPWSEWGPGAAVSLGGLPPRAGLSGEIARLKRITSIYTAKALESRSGRVPASVLARARDASAWATYQLGCLQVQSGRREAGYTTLEHVVLAYPKTGYAGAARRVLKGAGRALPE
ncbi:MAG: hypothetical protein R6V58_12965 [Planctomycetota bacterium]